LKDKCGNPAFINGKFQVEVSSESLKKLQRAKVSPEGIAEFSKGLRLDHKSAEETANLEFNALKQIKGKEYL
jgi:hypothetical protein